MKPKALILTTRDYSKSDPISRVKIYGKIKLILSTYFDVSVCRAQSLIESRGVLRIFYSILFKLRPLQVSIFDFRPALDALGKRWIPDLVLLDSVRSYQAMWLVKKKYPNARIVYDFDDLLSARFEEWIRIDAEVSLGYVENSIPVPLKKLIQVFSKLFYRYEANTLRRLEREAVQVANKIMLLSKREICLLCPDSEGDESKVYTYPVPVEPVGVPSSFNKPRRLVFIGSDTIVQNYKTIEYICELYGISRLPLDVYFYGKSEKALQKYGDVQGVNFCGYAESLRDVFSDDSVSLMPSFVKGGIKTKVLESMSYGIPVIGNDVAFDGIAEAFPTRFDSLKNLERFLYALDIDILKQSSAQGLRLIDECFSEHAFKNSMESIFNFDSEG